MSSAPWSHAGSNNRPSYALTTSIPEDDNQNEGKKLYLRLSSKSSSSSSSSSSPSSFFSSSGHHKASPSWSSSTLPTEVDRTYIRQFRKSAVPKTITVIRKEEKQDEDGEMTTWDRVWQNNSCEVLLCDDDSTEIYPNGTVLLETGPHLLSGEFAREEDFEDKEYAYHNFIEKERSKDFVSPSNDEPDLQSNTIIATSGKNDAPEELNEDKSADAILTKSYMPGDDSPPYPISCSYDLDDDESTGKYSKECTHIDGLPGNPFNCFGSGNEENECSEYCVAKIQQLVTSRGWDKKQEQEERRCIEEKCEKDNAKIPLERKLSSKNTSALSGKSFMISLLMRIRQLSCLLSIEQLLRPRTHRRTASLIILDQMKQEKEHEKRKGT